MTDAPIVFDILKRYEGFTLECKASFQSGIIAVYGPSGSGKTTLLDCIAGLVSPDRGSIEIGGTPVYTSATKRDMPPEKRLLGYVFQESALFPHMNVRQNIWYGYNLTDPDRREIDPLDLIDLFQLEALLDRDVATLSGGERQRVALARALATSPRMLLLDEPMASLDVRFRGIIIRYLQQVWSELRTPMVLVSHSISEVFALAQDVLVLNAGRPVARGAPSSVLVHPGVGSLADYATFENLLDAEVDARSEEDGQVELSVGRVTLVAPSAGAQEGETVTVSLRAGDIVLALDVPSRISAQNAVQATVEEVHVMQGRVLVYLDIGVRLVAEITSGALRDLGLEPGQELYLIIKSTSILVLAGTEDQGF